MKLTRALMSACALLAGGILAHHLAGASVPSASQLFSFLFLAFALTIFLLDEKLSEEKLFAAIFIAQNGSHFLMGGKSENATIMFASHLLAGVATYLVIIRGRLLLDSIEYALRRLTSFLIPDTYSVYAFTTGNSGLIAVPHQISFRQRLRYSALSLRAPPKP